MPAASLWDYLKALPLYALPHHTLSHMAYRLTRSRNPLIKSTLIELFARAYAIDLAVAETPDTSAYASFNDFFTRRLRTDARPISNATNALVSPVDGVVSAVGDIHEGRLLQAKGHDYSLGSLLGADVEMERCFQGGQFVTIYLSPRDYHRIHMPLDGRLTKQVYVPGRLFAVNGPSTRVVPGLFARNERVIAHFETYTGPVAVVMVGALFVGSIETVWSGQVTPSESRTYSMQRFDGQRNQPVELSRGTELGRFNMGSTVILLFSKDRMRWRPGLTEGVSVRMGEAIAESR